MSDPFKQQHGELGDEELEKVVGGLTPARSTDTVPVYGVAAHDPPVTGPGSPIVAVHNERDLLHPGGAQPGPQFHMPPGAPTPGHDAGLSVALPAPPLHGPPPWWQPAPPPVAATPAPGEGPVTVVTPPAPGTDWVDPAQPSAGDDARAPWAGRSKP